MVATPGADVPTPWQVMVFLHGSGERGPQDGSALWRVKVHGPWRAPGAERFLILAPQCSKDQTWPGLAKRVLAMTQSAFKRYPADTSSCCITGLSMGAFGAWAVATQSPTVFRTVVPICGGYALPTLAPRTELKDVVRLAKRDWEPRDVAGLKKVRAWMFHGSKDAVVSAKGSRQMYKALGGATRGRRMLRLTIFKGMGYHCWSRAYRTPKLLDWASPPSRKRNRAA